MSNTPQEVSFDEVLKEFHHTLIKLIKTCNTAKTRDMKVWAQIQEYVMFRQQLEQDKVAGNNTNDFYMNLLIDHAPKE